VSKERTAHIIHLAVVLNAYHLLLDFHIKISYRIVVFSILETMDKWGRRSMDGVFAKKFAHFTQAKKHTLRKKPKEFP